jgi:hypothetical protein
MVKTRIQFLLLVLLCLSGTFPGGAGIITAPDLINPDEIKMDDTQIYFVDGVSIYIYSLNDLSFKKKFAKEGEEPRVFLKHPRTPEPWMTP